MIVGVDDRGKEALTEDPFIQSAIGTGWAVCGVDPRGIGELAVERIRWAAAASLLLNENFVWRQAWDLGCAVQSLQEALSLHDVGAGASKPCILYGRGDNAALAVTYALAQKPGRQASQPRAYILRDGFLSFRQFVDRPESMALSYRLRPDTNDPYTSYDHEIPYQYFVFDVLRRLDLPQLLSSVEAQGLVVNPLDGDWKQMSEPAARKFLPPTIRLACETHPEETMLHFLGG